jgi:hypothetical protein
MFFFNSTSVYAVTRCAPGVLRQLVSKRQFIANSVYNLVWRWPRIEGQLNWEGGKTIKMAKVINRYLGDVMWCAAIRRNFSESLKNKSVFPYLNSAVTQMLRNCRVLEVQKDFETDSTSYIKQWQVRDYREEMANFLVSNDRRCVKKSEVWRLWNRVYIKVRLCRSRVSIKKKTNIGLVRRNETALPEWNSGKTIKNTEINVGNNRIWKFKIMMEN